MASPVTSGSSSRVGSCPRSVQQSSGRASRSGSGSPLPQQQQQRGSTRSSLRLAAEVRDCSPCTDAEAATVDAAAAVSAAAPAATAATPEGGATVLEGDVAAVGASAADGAPPGRAGGMATGAAPADTPATAGEKSRVSVTPPTFQFVSSRLRAQAERQAAAAAAASTTSQQSTSSSSINSSRGSPSQSPYPGSALPSSSSPSSSSCSSSCSFREGGAGSSNSSSSSLYSSCGAATASRGGGGSGGRSGSSSNNNNRGVHLSTLWTGSSTSGRVGRRGGGMWCYICRDGVQRGEENVVECGACPKRFHLECLQQEGLLQPQQQQCGLSRGSGGGVVIQGEWLCPQCEEEQEEDEMQNDERCFICKKKEADSEDRLLLCDGCPNSYHMRSCLKMTIEPDEEKWFCPECNPAAFKRDEVRRLGRRGAPGVGGLRGAAAVEGRGGTAAGLGSSGAYGSGGGNAAGPSECIVNASSCYVCQRPGKLLGCDFCPNSFHPACLVDVDWNSIGEEWECPVCRGQDPLANQMHKRWTRAEIEVKRKERSKCLLRIRAKTVRYRNRFLLVHQKDLGPFVHPKVWSNLAKSLRAQVGGSLQQTQQHSGAAQKRGAGAAGGGRLQVERSMADLLEGLEDEALEECAKFVKRAYRATRYPSGRKIEGVPLREGIELKPHQEEGVEWLLCSFMTGGGILADEMGLGKTIQTLCFLSYLNAMKLEGPHLIVVPLSTVGNWMREVHRFTPSLTHIKICGSRAERQHALDDRLAQRGLYDLYITTYETVKSEEEFFVEVIPHWQCIVLDEAHRIKNASGGIRHALDRVVGNMRLLLTGTPLQNSAAELFTLINFLMPDVFRDSQLIEQAFLSAQQQQQLLASGQALQPHTTSSQQQQQHGGARGGGGTARGGAGGGGAGGGGSSSSGAASSAACPAAQGSAAAGSAASSSAVASATANGTAGGSGGGGAAGGAGGGGSSSSNSGGGLEVEQLFRQEDLEKIRNLLDRVMLRRLKEQAIALPKKTFHSVWLPLSGTAAAWYERLLRIRALQEASKERLHESSYRKMLGLVIKMRIICAHPKALCARESQMQRLQALFVEEEAATQQEVMEAAQQLQQLEGEQHVRCSAKLCFLDKLLCHLHSLNCRFVPGYEREYDNHRREAATYKFYKQHEERVKEAVAAGRKPPRRPKRVELPGLPAFQLLLQKGDPRLAGVKAAADASYLEESMYAAELVMPVLPERSAAGAAAAVQVGGDEEEEEQQKQQRAAAGGREGKAAEADCGTERDAGGAATGAARKQEREEQQLKKEGSTDVKQETGRSRKSPCYVNSGTAAATGTWGCPSSRGSGAGGVKLELATTGHEGGGKQQMKLQVGGAGGSITLLREKKALDKAAHAEPQTGGSAAAAAEARRTAATAAEAARAAALAIDEEEEEQLPRPIFSTKKKRGVVIVDDDEREKSCSPEAPDAAAAAALATGADHDGASVAAAPAVGSPTVLLSAAGAPAAPGGNGATHAEEQRELRDGVKQEEMQKQAAGGTAPSTAAAAWAKEEEQQADEPGRKTSIDPSGRKQEAASQAKREEETEEREGQETTQQDGAPQKTENKEEGKKAISPSTEEARRDALQQKQQEDVLCRTTCSGSQTDEPSSKSAARPAAFPSLREAGGDVTAASGVSAAASGPSDAAAATAGAQQQKGKVPFEIDRSQPRLQRLLVFTQFQLVLDELESYCQFRGWKYLRLDGSTNKFVRELDIRDFNSETSTYFVYLISTRAGGLGINLTAANHVVLYDHDWNPFIDLQAVDRAHRIGQQREVHVWSLVNEWTVEERMAFRRDQKLRLDKLLVQHQQEESLEVEDEEKQQNRGEKISTDEIRRLMLHGRKAIMEVAAKRPIEIFDCSLEELASRQRLRLPELGSSGAAGGGTLGSAGTADGEEGDAAAADATGDDARRREGDEEEEDGDSREETEDQELVDIDEVMNEEAEEQMKQQQLLEAADGMGPEENVDSSRSRDAGGGSSSGGTSQAESRTGATAAGGRTASAAGEAAGTAAQGGSGDAAEDAAAAGPEGKAAAAAGAAAAGAAGTPGGAAEKSTGGSCGAASPSTKGDLEKELQSAGVLWRSGRERKKPTAVYVPQEFGQREERKKIRHEQRCFICGQSRDFEQVVTDAEGKQHKIALGDLIPCSGCPRAYHRECEGLGKEVKKSWRCRWHECCLCFRKTSQCGNMLIHCARCPTSFCYDCFPPDYCRYNVGEEYYSQLRQRGMNVTPQNWILLLCSRCKAVEEQQTRRRLTKEEKEQEKQQQKELRQQQKELHEGLETKGRGGGGSGSSKDGAGGGGTGGAAGEGGGAAGGRHRAEEERRFFENKHKVDAIEAKQEEELRQAYQKLFPAAFTEELHKRVHAAKAAQKMNREASLAMQAQAAAAALAEGRKAAQEAAASVEDQQQKLHAAVAAAQQAAASAKKAQQQKRPVNQLVNMKLPAASLGLCDNCRLPCHGVKDYPGACCFPPEVVSKFFVRNSGGAGSALLPLKDAPAAAAGESPQQERQQVADQKAGDGEGGSASLEEQQQSGGSGSSGAKGTPVSAESQPTCNGAQGANSSVTGHAASAGEGDSAAAKKTLTPLAAAVGGGPLSPALKNLLASGEGATGAGISAATAAELAAAGIDSVKVVHKQVCGCCGECRTGKRSHLRKHCLSLSEEDKAKYAERRELVQQLIGWLLQQTPIPDTAAAGYSTASPQRLKGYYQQYQTQADRVVEEGMVAVGLGAAVAQRSFARRPYNTLAAGTPVLAARGGSAASVSMNGSGGQIALQSPQQDGTCASNTNSKNSRAGSAAAGAAANGAAAGGEAAAAGASGSPTTGVGWSAQQKSRKRATHVTPPSSSSNSSNYGSASAAAAAGGSGSVGTGAGSVGGAKKRPTSCSGGNVLAAAAVGSSGPAAGGSESSGSHRRPSGSPRYGGGGRESGGISDVELLGVMHASQNASLHAQQHPAAKNAKTLGTGGGSRRGQSGATPRAGGSAAAGTRGAGGGQGTAGRTGTGGAFGDKGSGGSAAAGGREAATEDEIGANDKLLVTNPWNPTSSPVVLPAGGSAAMSSLLHAKDACALGVKLLQAAAASAAGPLMKGNFSAAAAAATAASLAAGMRAAAKRPADNSCKGPTTAKKIRAGTQSPAAAGAGAGSTECSMNVGARGSAARSVIGAGGGPASAAGPPAAGGAGGLEAAALLKRRKSPFPHTRDAYSSNNFVSSSSSGGLPPQNVPAAVESSGLHNAIGGGGNTAAPQPPPAPAPFKQQKSIIDFFLTKTKGGVPITSNSLSYAADSMRTSTAAPVGGPLAALAALVAARRATSGATSPPPASSGATLGGGYR